MANIPQTTYSNIPAYPKSWYQSSGNWSAKTVSVAADRYKLTSPTAMQIDVNNLSLTSTVATEPDLSLDGTWDFGQNVGIWTAGRSYAVCDWVRCVTQNQSQLASPVWQNMTLEASGTPPQARDSGASIYYNGYMYIFGGYTTTNKNDVHRLNLSTKAWSGALSTTGTPPSARQGHTAVYYYDTNTSTPYMYIFGGHDAIYRNDVHRLNLTTLAWSNILSCSGTPPPGSRYANAICVGDYMYIMQGYNSTDGHMNKVHRLNLTTLAWSGEITPSGTPPSARVGSVLGYYNNYIYVACGGAASKSNEIHRLDITNSEALSWSGALSTTGTPPTAVAFSAGGISDGYLYLYGGYTSVIAGGVHRINLTTLVWSGALSVVNNPPSNRYVSMSVINAGYMYIFGGYDVYNFETNHLYELNLSNNVFTYKCTAAGTSLSSEPTWGTTVGGTTAESGGPTWTCYYDDKAASNRAGVDYYIYSCIDTTVVPKIIISRNSTYPHGYTASNSRKIGGFHCLCASVGTIANHPLTGYLTGDILPTSVWDLKKRSPSLIGNIGQVYDLSDDLWKFIYFPSGTGVATTCAYGGTISAARSFFDFTDDALAIGMRIITTNEFYSAAIGSNEGTVIYGAALPTVVNGSVDSTGRRMISNIGIELACGALNQWTRDRTYRFDSADFSPAFSYKDPSGGKGKINGQGTYGDCVVIAGGAATLVTWPTGTSTTVAGDMGSRSRDLGYYPWKTSPALSARFVARSIHK
jgi:hypothetical protein